MLQFDDSFLESAGLGAEQKQSLMQHIMDELEMRVGTRLSEGLSASPIAKEM